MAMDTVVVRLRNPALQQLALKHLNSGLPLDQIATRPWHIPSRLKQLGRREGMTSIQIAGQELLVGWWKWDRSGDIMHTAWHSSRFPSWTEVVAWLRSVFGDLVGVLLHEQIVRLDLCIDLLVPHEELWRSLSAVGGRRVMTVTSSSGTTVYLGSAKKGRQTYCYRKFLEAGQEWDWRRPRLPKRLRHDCGSRIEVRLRGDKLPIIKLADVDRLADTRPFQHLRSTALDLAESFSTLTAHRKLHVYGVREVIRMSGAAAAKRFYGQACRGNYARDVGRHLKSYELPDLDEVYRKRMQRFLAPQMVFRRDRTKKSKPIDARPEVTL